MTFKKNFVRPRRPWPGAASRLPVDGERRLPPLLRRAWYGLNQAFRRRIAHLGITPDQYTVLRIVSETPGLTQRELTDRMCSDPNTVASVVRRMQAAGLLARQPHENDRRAYRLQLKPLGRQKLTCAREFAQVLQEDVLAAIPADHQTMFLEHLAQVAEACRQAIEAPAVRASRRRN